jgi:hypothetical protein
LFQHVLQPVHLRHLINKEGKYAPTFDFSTSSEHVESLNFSEKFHYNFWLDELKIEMGKYENVFDTTEIGALSSENRNIDSL